jgi:hypothetical protein
VKKILILFISIIIVFVSCKKEKFATSSDAKLEFSVDTLFFDTVFTNIGSQTKQFKIYNNNNGTIIIDNIRLANGSASNYRLNINGIPSSSVKDIELLQDDSLFIFVEVTVDPNNLNTPFVVEDSIIFNVNENLQDIDLRSWGQNAHYIDGRTMNAIIGDTTWTADKPYLIYNSMLVDSLKTLIINEGVEIYLHKNSNIYILGTLEINGTFDNPVKIRGDRLDHAYDDVPGQWGRMVFIEGSKNNKINFAEISGGIIGVQVGGSLDAPISDKPDLLMTNTKIQHMNYAGLYTLGSKVVASNCVISNVGFYAVALLLGGDYEFYHCTIANYWSYANRTEPSVVISNNIISNGTMFLSDLNNAYFGNCIIYGNKENELGLSNELGALFDYKFENSIVRANSDLDFSDNTYYNNVWKSKNPRFIDASEYNFQLDTLSQAKDIGDLQIVNSYLYSPSIVLDLNENDRTIDAMPDLGAFERVE